MRYFVRVTAGTEDLAWREIGRLDGAQQIASDHRRLDFEYSGSPADLLALRSVDDVYVYVGELRPIDHTRAMLEVIRQGVAWMDFTDAVNVCGAARTIPENPAFTVTASLLGSRNYNRFEVSESVHVGMYDTHWDYVENAPDHAPVDLDARVLVEGDWLMVGLRLGAAPLHRRPYKLDSLPGSLKPPVAYCMALLADIQPGDVLLDPMCGAGTIPIEASAFNAGTIFAADVNAQAANVTRANSVNAGVNVRVLCADARHVPLADDSVDRVVSNLPWGKQVTADLPDLYAALIREVDRVLRSDGRCVLLTDQADALNSALEGSGLHHVESKPISLYGSHPAFYTLRKG